MVWGLWFGVLGFRVEGTWEGDHLKNLTWKFSWGYLRHVRFDPPVGCGTETSGAPLTFIQRHIPAGRGSMLSAL